ncbi:MAG: methylmalonyl-CoA/ethylmalonyl-CoA epimerase [Gaiellales bacterium]|jgi:methylmalonyl-CoA/ethylmalonyl-CoA epimerase|nr:methylmalonyl-CoA/ethylmalonyl-CoA epimerase [Gaiellales bacterium]
MRRVAARDLHHVGIAVADLDAAVARWRTLLGAEVEAEEEVASQGVRAVALHTGSGRVELLSALTADTPVGRFLERRGEGMHHLAFSVDDVQAELSRLRAAGATLIDEQPRQGLYGPVAFVHPETMGGVLVELVGRQAPAFSKEAR